MTLRVGSLFSGYDGLGVAFDLLGVDVERSWFAESDRWAGRVLDVRWPGVPNLGDVTRVDWAAVPGVDVLTGGFPCQDVSVAGPRRGLHADTRSGLWSHMCEAVDVLRPRLVVIENVPGLRSAAASSGGVERCGWCVDDGGAVAVRALGAVVGSLAGVGYDARWGTVGAADVGAPHRRRRVFIVGYPHGESRFEWGFAAGDETARRGAWADVSRSVGTSPVGVLLPTPTVVDMGEGKSPEAWDAWREAMMVRHRNGQGHGRSLFQEVSSGGLVPSPMARDYRGAGIDRGPGSKDDDHVQHVARRPGFEERFGPALHRWAGVLGREWPAPTVDGRINHRFVEWMMGLPAGHVTDVVSWRQSIKMLGNGVVPLQAAAAVTALTACLGPLSRRA